MTTETVDRSATVAGAAANLLQILATMDRPDLTERATAAAARARRPGSVVTVVGEFKQGKSSLVNGLLGSDVCPVDDDLATSAITLVSYGQQAAALVRHREDGEQKATRVELNQLGDWVSETGNPGNVKEVERVEIKFSSALLKSGMMIVDTPGMGGLGSGHAAATLSFLPFADGLILVSDASAELSAPEVEFLAKATELCPTVMFVQTKIDLYGEWERIFELNRGHLAAHGIQVPMVAVSSTLRFNALQRADKNLNELSNFPELITALGAKIVAPAKATAADRSAADLRGIVGMLESGLASEKGMLEDPSAFTDAIADLERAKERLEFLRGPGAKWSTVVNDAMSDLSTSVTHGFRSGMRGIQRDLDERIEELKTAEDWDELVRDLQTDVAEAAAILFQSIAQGREDVHAEVSELLADEQLGLAELSGGIGSTIDVMDMWQGKDDLDGTDSKMGKGVRSALGVAQSLTSAKMLMGSMSGLSKFGVSLGVLGTGPFIAGGFVLMGGMKVMDDRKRQLAQRRQTARQQVRQFIEDVQFDVNNEASILIRNTQRELRDEFGDRLKELQRTYADTAQSAQDSAKATQSEAKARLAEVDKAMHALRTIAAAL